MTESMDNLICFNGQNLQLNKGRLEQMVALLSITNHWLLRQNYACDYDNSN